MLFLIKTLIKGNAMPVREKYHRVFFTKEKKKKKKVITFEILYLVPKIDFIFLTHLLRRIFLITNSKDIMSKVYLKYTQVLDVFKSIILRLIKNFAFTHFKKQ